MKTQFRVTALKNRRIKAVGGYRTVCDVVVYRAFCSARDAEEARERSELQIFNRYDRLEVIPADQMEF